MPILNYKDRGTHDIADQLWTKAARRKLPALLHQQAYQLLAFLNGITSLQDFRLLPSSRLEKLKGERRGQYSIRINKQYRICFHWLDRKALNVEIVDYHD